MSPRTLISAGLVVSFFAVALPGTLRSEERAPASPAPLHQTADDAQQKSAGCMTCHTTTDSLTMHTSPGVTLGCADCHGGNAGVFLPAAALPGSAGYHQTLDKAHVH